MDNEKYKGKLFSNLLLVIGAIFGTVMAIIEFSSENGIGKTMSVLVLAYIGASLYSNYSQKKLINELLDKKNITESKIKELESEMLNSEELKKENNNLLNNKKVLLDSYNKYKNKSDIMESAYGKLKISYTSVSKYLGDKKLIDAANSAILDIETEMLKGRNDYNEFL